MDKPNWEELGPAVANGSSKTVAEEIVKKYGQPKTNVQPSPALLPYASLGPKQDDAKPYVIKGSLPGPQSGE